MRTRNVLVSVAAAVVLAACGGSGTGSQPPTTNTFQEKDPAGYAACEAYMAPPPGEVAEQLEDDLDLVLYSGAAAYEHAIEATTEEIAASVNEELTQAGVPSVVAAALITACENNGFAIEPGSAAEAAQNA